VHNRKATTLSCLAQLQQNGDLERYYSVVIDDGSTDGTKSAIQANYSEVEVLAGDGNLWWTGAIVQGMKYAYAQGAEFFIWLNDDCQVSANAISDLVKLCRENQGAIVGCQGQEREQIDRIAFGGKVKTWQGYRLIHAPKDQVTACDLLSGNLVCIPRIVVEKIGYPDPQIMPHYGGDSLYLIRAQKAGFQIFVDTRNSVVSLSGKPKLYPEKWLLDEGKPLKIMRLVFVPQSGLSWRIWLRLNWEAYSIWGLVMFLKKYLSILLITLLRFLPLSWRKSIFTNRA
jgi:GT2 family glycosyltransferase